MNDTRTFALVNTVPMMVNGSLLKDAIAIDPLTGTLYVSARNPGLLDFETLWRFGVRDFVINVSVTDMGGNIMNETRLTTYAEYVRAKVSCTCARALLPVAFFHPRPTLHPSLLHANVVVVVSPSP